MLLTEDFHFRISKAEDQALSQLAAIFRCDRSTIVRLLLDRGLISLLDRDDTFFVGHISTGLANKTASQNAPGDSLENEA